LSDGPAGVRGRRILVSSDGRSGGVSGIAVKVNVGQLSGISSVQESRRGFRVEIVVCRTNEFSSFVTNNKNSLKMRKARENIFTEASVPEGASPPM
jgi:hypothetical protein